jgi:peptidoglycan/xylan/chitin deacetylase (PgdA/CDA1 family)
MNDRPLPLLPLVLARVPRSLRRALEQEGVPFVEQAVAPAGGRFLLFDSMISTGPHGVPGQTPINVNLLRSAWSEDPFALLEDDTAIRKVFDLGALAPSETVSRVDKRIVREQLLADLRKRIETAGGVWLRIGAFPYPFRSAFNFRIDHDDYAPLDFSATLAAIAGYENSISHYVCAATHTGQPEALARLSGSHVGSHGYWHHTYRSVEENLRNIGRGIQALQAAGVEPVGFAAPHGRFNVGLREALEQLRIEHSSEFALAYDDLPFFPLDGRVLQLPVHPICLGICLEAARQGPWPQLSPADAAQIALSHFRRMIAEKREAGEPIFLYGHPEGRLGRFPHVLRSTLHAAARYSDIWRTTLAEFSAWWRVRGQVAIEASLDAERRLRVRVRGISSQYRFALEYCRGAEVATVPLDGSALSFPLDGPFAMSRAIVPRTFPQAAEQPEALRASLRRYLDWERVTPIEEISVHNWQGWAKRTLRRIKN